MLEEMKAEQIFQPAKTMQIRENTMQDGRGISSKQTTAGTIGNENLHGREREEGLPVIWDYRNKRGKVAPSGKQ